MKKVDLAKLKQEEIASIIVEWFIAQNDLDLQKDGINLYTFHVAPANITVNRENRIIAYDIKDDGKTYRTILKQSHEGFTIKSDQYTDLNEYPLETFASEHEILFIMSEPSERQYIRLTLK